MVKLTRERPGAAYATDKFGLLFAELVALLVLTAFAEISRLLLIFTALMAMLVVITALRAVGTTPERMRIATGVALVVFAVVAVTGAWFGRTGRGILWVGLGIALGVGAAGIVRRIFEHETVGIQQLLAALAAYLQFGLAFGALYVGIDEMTSAAFFAQSTDGVTGVYLYFSVVTITTLGYGDFSPATSIGRSLVMIETLFGQIILVVLVAYLVGSLGGRRAMRGENDAGT